VWLINYTTDSQTGAYAIDARPQLLDSILLMDAPLVELGDTIVVPKTYANFSDDFRDSPLRDIVIHRAGELFLDVLRNELDRLYDKLDSLPFTLHAHSQGGIIAAVAHSRLGTVLATRRSSVGREIGEVSVADKIDLISYGGGANMYDWGPIQRYKSYTHHVNQKDAVANLLGMGDPFQSYLKLPLFGFGLPGNLLARSASDHAGQIRLKAPRILKDAWANFHTVIYHESEAYIPNLKEHNFTRSYICNVAPDPSTLLSRDELNKFDGGKQCLDQ
jgi:hypothetical protein